MRKATFVVVVILTACGGDDGATPIDAPMAIDAPGQPSPCDTVAQNCGAGFKCTLVVTTRTCVPVPSTPIPLGGACTSSPPDFHDDCDAGLICTVGRCHRLCTGAQPQCANGGSCFQFHTPQDGACQDPCTLFDSGGCQPGETCEPGFRLGATGPGLRCRPIGTLADGEDCGQTAEQCLANSVCGTIDALVCGALCDPTHPCTTGTCHTIPNVTYGVCS